MKIEISSRKQKKKRNRKLSNLPFVTLTIAEAYCSEAFSRFYFKKILSAKDPGKIIC